MKAVIYARYSSENQREESIEGQLRDCNSYAEYNGIEVVGTYIDRAFSAKTDDRPDFQRMIADAPKKLFDVVLVWKLDRFARNRYDSAYYKRILKKYGIRLITAKESIPDGPEGIILEGVIESMAEYYSANLSQNVKRGFRENALKGKWNGGTVPFGYKVVDHRLVIDEESAPIVALAFQMCADGKTAKEIFDFLRLKGLRRSDGKLIAYNSVLYMLSNRTYIGEYRHSGIVLEDAIPAIIDKGLFERVQATVQKHSIAPAAHKEENDYLLTTHLYCGKCGALMTAYSGTSQNGKAYRYYICNRARKHLCDKHKVDKEKIENFIVNKTMQFLQQDEIIDRLADLLYDLQYEENTLLPKLEKKIAEKKKEIDNIVTAIQKGVASDTLLARLNELEEQKKAFEEQLIKERATSPLFTKEQFKMALFNFRNIDTTTKVGKAKLIDTFIDRVYLYDDSIKIIYTVNGKQEDISLEELESSNLSQSGQPQTLYIVVSKIRAQYIVFCFLPKIHKTVIFAYFYPDLGVIWETNGDKPAQCAVLSP